MKGSQSSSNASTLTSFRDPAGRLLIIDGRVLRIVNSTGVEDFRAFLNSTTARRFVEQGRLVRTEILDSSTARDVLANSQWSDRAGAADESIVAEHERVAFQSFPYEWPPEMLHAAGLLTLDLAESLLGEGLGLKDATPYNILFRGPEPVFVDSLSFERRKAGDPIWLPEAQFERTFLLPLLVNKYFSLQLDQLLSVRRDGLEPEVVYSLCGPVRRLLPPFLSMVSIPTWLSGRKNEDDAALYRSRVLENTEKASFILESLFKRLRRRLNDLEPEGGKKSEWSDYVASNNNYTEAHFTAKSRFVEDVMTEFSPERVLDIGCNTGHFSLIAAKSGASVLAVDSDAVVVGEAWRKARGANLNILPLVVNLTRPSPALGWRNRECPAFLDRTRGAFDAVMLLAVIHHMLVSERIPLAEVLDLAADLTTDIVIIEFVASDDSMFRRLTRGRDHLFADLTPQLFEETCRRKFKIIRSQHLDQTSRWLYLLRKR
jgi:SAM-dependent methyltransferase